MVREQIRKALITGCFVAVGLPFLVCVGLVTYCAIADNYFEVGKRSEWFMPMPLNLLAIFLWVFGFSVPVGMVVGAGRFLWMRVRVDRGE